MTLHVHLSHLVDDVHDQSGLRAFLKGTSEHFSPSRLWDSNQRTFGYWSNALNCAIGVSLYAIGDPSAGVHIHEYIIQCLAKARPP